MRTVRDEVRQFHIVTVAASIVGAVLWMSAGSIGAASGNIWAYIIVALLAMTASMIAVNSAKKEGVVEGEARGIIRKRTKQYQEPEE